VIKEVFGKVRVRIPRVIHAGPTSGKSVWGEKLRSAGYRVLDTDSPMHSISPEWGELQPWKKLGEPWLTAWNANNDRAVAYVVEAALAMNAVDLVLTNRPIGSIVPVGAGAWVRDPGDMSQRSMNADRLAKHPLQGIPVDLCAKWIAGYDKKMATGAYGPVIRRLREGEFLSDVFELAGPPVAVASGWASLETWLSESP